jgi:hypothetical protein
LPTRLSKALGVSHSSLVAQGAFDAFIDVDSLLYLDPHLLAYSQHSEFAPSAKRFEDHFRDVFRLLKASKTSGDIAWEAACKLLTFPEPAFVALGYSKHSTRGRAIGPSIAANLTSLAKQIVDLGIEDVELFALLGLLQEGVGSDLISDMTISIIMPDLISFSQRVAHTLGIGIRPAIISRGSHELPHTKGGRSVLLVPADMLRKLPMANSWEDADQVASHNSTLRAHVNTKIGNTWREATSRRVRKQELRETILAHPELMRDLIGLYRAKKATGYDFAKDPDGVQVWFEIAEELSASLPLDLSTSKTTDLDELFDLVLRICTRFQDLVEDNRLGRILYNDDGSPRSERIAQLFFFSLASFYCDANNLDVSPEADAGVGPVDFKISQGSTKVTVEMKLSSNPKLVHGFEEQLPTYNRAEKSTRSVFLVVRNGDHDTRLKQLATAVKNAPSGFTNVPKVVVVDGRAQTSASKRKPSRGRNRAGRS